MHLRRIRNRVLQMLYRPPSRPRLMPAQTLASLDAIERAIDQKITPLLAGLLKN